MPPPPLWIPLLVALLCAHGCGSDSPPVILKPVEPIRRPCWTIDDDRTIPVPPPDGATAADEADYEVRLTAAFWKLRCACGERRPEWCNYDGTIVP